MGNTTTTTCGGDDDDDFPPTVFCEDLFIQILVWLPVKSLLRFKSVCKSWCALIETPLFIDLHTTTTTFKSSSSKFGSFILHVSEKMFMLSSKSGSGSGSVCGSGDDDYEDEDIIIDNHQADDLGFSPVSGKPFFLHSRLYMHMVGSCNGLICIHESKGVHDEAVYLWNPATRQFRILPKPITIEEEGEKKLVYVFVAFGFDVKTKDYKVVMFKSFGTPVYTYVSRIQVYNLSTDSWRLLEGIHSWHALPDPPFFQNQGIYMNGCYFFVGTDITEDYLWGGGKTLVRNNSVMYSFDFTKEILTTMQLPDHDSRHDMILSCLGADKIALFMIQRNISMGGRVRQFHDCGLQFHDCGLDNEYYDIWVLNEQPGSNWVGVVNKESWTKLHSFPIVNKRKHLTQPRCILNNGEFALISTRRNQNAVDELELFNLVTKEAKKDFPVGYGMSRADVYIQSLVSIIGGNGAAAAATTTAERVADNNVIPVDN